LCGKYLGNEGYLRWFESISGLKVNFSKNGLFGVNVANSFLEGVAHFLYCNRAIFPFIYLGLSVGSNRGLLSIWNPVVKTTKKRIISWQNQSIIKNWGDPHKFGVGINSGILSPFPKNPLNSKEENCVNSNECYVG
jgi:hypothetical protein